MATTQVLKQESIMAGDVKDILDEVQGRDGELSFRAGKTMDHLNHISAPAKKDREKMVAAIEGLEVPRLKPLHVHKIVDLMPRNVKELNVILSGYTLTVNKEYQQKIIDALTA